MSFAAQGGLRRGQPASQQQEEPMSTQDGIPSRATIELALPGAQTDAPRERRIAKAVQALREDA